MTTRVGKIGAFFGWVLGAAIVIVPTAIGLRYGADLVGFTSVTLTTDQIIFLWVAITMVEAIKEFMKG